MPLLSFRDLEQDSGISRYTWRLWTSQGKLASHKLGRRVVVDERDYRDFLQVNRRGTAPQPVTLQDWMFHDGR
jgi:hypothetical protein